MGSIGRVFRRCGGFTNRSLPCSICGVMQAARDTMPNLPDDAAALRGLVLMMMAERDALVTERDILLSQNDRLRHLLLKLRRMQFGAKSERLPEGQLQLCLEEIEQAIARGDAEAEKRDPDVRKDGV